MRWCCWTWVTPGADADRWIQGQSWCHSQCCWRCVMGHKEADWTSLCCVPFPLLLCGCLVWFEGERQETGGTLTWGTGCCGSPWRFAPGSKEIWKIILPLYKKYYFVSPPLKKWMVRPCLPDRQWWWGQVRWRQPGSSRSRRLWGPRTQQSCPSIHTPLGQLLSGRRWKPGRKQSVWGDSKEICKCVSFTKYGTMGKRCLTPPYHTCNSLSNKFQES